MNAAPRLAALTPQVAPRLAADPEREPEPPALPPAEVALLREAAHHIAALRAGRACAVFLIHHSEPPEAQRQMQVAAPDASSEARAMLPPALAEQVLAALRATDTLPLDDQAPLWRWLVALQWLPDLRLTATSALPPGQAAPSLTLFAVRAGGDGGDISAAVAIQDAVASPIGGEQRVELALARIVTTLAGATLAALRLARAVEAGERASDAFLSLTVHELRSPLTAIKGYGQLLLRQARKLGLPPQIERAADAIEQQATRMADMIAEMHDAVRIRRGDIELHWAEVDLVPLIEHAVEQQRLYFPQHMIQVSVSDSSLIGRWDPQRVEQVVAQLINNAARYSPGGGDVEVHARRQESADRQVRGEPATVLVCVRDRGVGVAEDERERIFEYLYRAPETKRRNLAGLGLGLFVSRSLIERMGGALWLAQTQRDAVALAGHSPDVTDAPAASGSIFCFTLPLGASA
jgi:signal transduction histidine kinase